MKNETQINGMSKSEPTISEVEEILALQDCRSNDINISFDETKNIWEWTANCV